MKFSDNLLKALPKTDLHLHLDGSMRLSTLIELARRQGLKLPSYTEEGLKELVFKEKYANLGEYLHGFAYTCSVMRCKESIEQISYELAIDCQNEGVRYIEVRFAPQLLMGADGLSMEEVLSATNAGLKKAQSEFNQKIDISREPRFEYGIIVCAMRMFTDAFSPYYQEVAKRASTDNRRNKYQLAAYELVQEAVRIRDSLGIPIVGLDLAGQEDGYPAEEFSDAYQLAYDSFMRNTVHAGEAYGAESIFQAVNKLHADRIGHGYYLFDQNKVSSQEILDKEKYVKSLIKMIADKRLTIEVCLTSNLQTNPELKSIAHHPLGKMLENKISATICTDNTLVSNTTVTKELKLAIENFDLGTKEVKDLLINGFKRSFFPSDYVTKRRYVRQVIDYFDALTQDNH